MTRCIVFCNINDDNANQAVFPQGERLTASNGKCCDECLTVSVCEYNGIIFQVSQWDLESGIYKSLIWVFCIFFFKREKGCYVSNSWQIAR